MWCAEDDESLPEPDVRPIDPHPPIEHKLAWANPAFLESEGGKLKPPRAEDSNKFEIAEAIVLAAVNEAENTIIFSRRVLTLHLLKVRACVLAVLAAPNCLCLQVRLERVCEDRAVLYLVDGSTKMPDRTKSFKVTCVLCLFLGFACARLVARAAAGVQ